ncbi:serine-rich adhesin for platelets-like [Anopheles darlingi]|uniref:serine-rich adhesin for platelets-like n=1 Tax=Anopheles darlingi TaxID=43151 RepID=UPI00210052EA|nr:serine-rich adhesin for platelets-like [Anopheles darlingi]XP_049543932.1 serine-rich adhesin for platelets-like [Anopheles darlingi]XP_049543933.1 serine-rich adhesin for platelets-like [Anopheles darlingi]
MAKGAKRKTKWVSLSLDGANTTTSSGVPGSDGEQPLHHVHRHKAHHSSSNIQQKQNERKDPTGDAVTEHSASIRATEQEHQNGSRTDTSGSGSDSAVAGSERRYPTSYHKRRPPPYSTERRTNSSWSGGGGGGHYAGSNRSHYGGYYGTGRRSYYGEARRGPQSVVGTTGSKTTTTSDSGGATNTINDDEYTRITTPRQDVLFKKGYLSRPKPQTTTTTTTTTTMTAANASNENTTASSSLAGTTSEGSEGGNGGGSNSISTTESITSDYGGSFAADSFPIPCLPYGYFTENGVLVMNGFAVDNNGYSYFNGGQTYIYPPNFSNCQAPTSVEGIVPEEVALTSSSGEEIYEGTAAITEEQSDEAQPTACGEDGTTECTAASDGVLPIPDPSTMHGVMTVEEGSSDQQEANVADGFLVSQTTGATVNDEGSFEPDLEANGFYQFNDSYDMAQFYSSVCYPQWCMGHYGLCEDGTPLQATEYVMPNGEVYTHQTSFKKRKKRFRHHDEVQQDESATVLDSGATPVPLIYTTVPVQGDFVPSSTTTTVPAQLHHQLNADVQEFLPSAVTPGTATTDVTERTTSHRSARRSNTQPTATKKSISTASSASKSVAPVKATVVTTPVESVATVTSAKTVPNALRPPLGSHKNRKKDLIESTLAFAEQNIDLTRHKLAASQSHDSDLLWTTVSKGGRKRVVEQDQPLDTAITGSSDRQVDEAKPVIESQKSIKQSEPVAISSSETRPLATFVDTPEAESKKEVTGKNKKKTQKHKRQQRKPGNAVMHRQPLEGFQLIEPEFTSKPDLASQRGTKGCDSEVQDKPEYGDEAIDPVGCNEVVEEVLEIEEAHVEDDLVVSPPLLDENKVVACIIEKEEEKEEKKEEVPHDELICDRIVQHVDSAPAVECIVVECPEPAEPVPESQIVIEQAIDDEIILNETETEKKVMLEVATMANTADESECYEPAESKTEECLSLVAANEKESTAPIVEETAMVKEELNQPPAEQSASPVEEPLIECIAIKPLLTLAAAPERGPDEKTPRISSDSEEADEEEMSEDRHRKRDSVSGYTESIDSGLQSPAPCGQATPETSSLASSHETEPHEDEDRQQQLSQLVGRWLTRKLEDHEPDEVFVLPHSNPLLMQRLHRFQQLQCNRDRLASDSYDEDDDDDDERDTDSDYMSDGQGRHDVATNPSSPVLNHVPEQQEQHQLQNGAKSQNLHLKQPAAVLNGNTKTTASSTISEQAQQKRCIIM